MITCEQFIAELGSYLQGDIAIEVRRQVESHLSCCQTCRVIYDSTCKTIKIVTDSGSFDLPAAAANPIRDKIMARLRKKTAS
jgi:predicted anti-sigma-YlaC factor YlaD